MAKSNDRRQRTGRFVGVPYHVFSSTEYVKLSNPACRVLWELAGQFYGKNNGALSACGALLAKRGITEGSRYRGIKELIDSGFVVITRQGWQQRGRPTLVALTWLGIDEVQSIEYDDGIKPSSVPLNYWKNHDPKPSKK